MTTQPLPTLPDSWQAAMLRANTNHLDALKLNERGYAVRSIESARSMHHVVALDACGRIVGCDCPDWRGRHAPCRHAAAVAKRLLRERKHARGMTLIARPTGACLRAAARAISCFERRRGVSLAPFLGDSDH